LERRRKIAETNQDVIYALRPGVAEGVIPERDVITALVRATSRKHEIPYQDAYDCSSIAEELIKEVMDSSFISAKQKLEYCDSLKTLMSAEAEEPASATEERLEVIRGSRIGTVMATFLAGISAVMTGVAFLITASSGGNSGSQLTSLVLPTLVVSAVPILMIGVWYLARMRRSTDRSIGPGSGSSTTSSSQ